MIGRLQRIQLKKVDVGKVKTLSENFKWRSPPTLPMKSKK